MIGLTEDRAVYPAVLSGGIPQRIAFVATPSSERGCRASRLRLISAKFSRFCVQRARHSTRIRVRRPESFPKASCG